jgi:hypothetical protein
MTIIWFFALIFHLRLTRYRVYAPPALNALPALLKKNYRLTLYQCYICRKNLRLMLHRHLFIEVTMPA